MNPKIIMNTRPIYETPANIAAENAVSEAISKLWDIKIVKLKRLYPFDRAVIRDKEITGFLEIKCRPNPKDQYPEYMISLDKIRWALEIRQTLGHPCFLAVQWTDQLGIHRIDSKMDYWVGMGGRIDRNDPQDMEPVVMINTKWFKNL